MGLSFPLPYSLACLEKTRINYYSFLFFRLDIKRMFNSTLSGCKFKLLEAILQFSPRILAFKYALGHLYISFLFLINGDNDGQGIFLRAVGHYADLLPCRGLEIRDDFIL
ncbi:hypothetical protein PEDI_41380 [Persicobacter diffluens]|uniref:Uncharacterized protein n=1 Tax=Persicobacter diffluens TaxID=981 RepID=A0AAN4W2N5_9BACT|nr:hypothetical protein PEDI_41380 [Persicobacter diffluens]